MQKEKASSARLIRQLKNMTDNAVDQVILYDYWRSSASYRVRIALNLAGLKYENIKVDLLAKDHKSSEHLARNPQGLVPVLKIDGHSFTQSLAILEYLDQTRELDLVPADPVNRAKIRALAYIFAVDVHPICNLSVMQHATNGQEPARTDWMQHFITPGLRAFEQQLATHNLSPFINGAKPGLAEICLIPQLYNADRWNVDYSDCPNIIKLRNTCVNQPAFLKAFPREN